MRFIYRFPDDHFFNFIKEINEQKFEKKSELSLIIFLIKIS